MKRVLLLLEFVCLFGPAIVLLCLAAFFVGAILLADGFEGGGEGLLLAACVVGGSWGVVSAANLAFHLVADWHWPGKPIQRFGLGLGGAACGLGVILLQASPLSLALLAPVAATIHFVALARSRAAS